MRYLLATTLANFLINFIAWTANADKYDNHYYPPVTTYMTEVTELVNTTNIENYTPDTCQGIAIAQAGANNMMYLGTHKPQLSLGVGECDGQMAGSIMFGVKPCKNCPMINGSWAMDENVNAFGVGATIIFK